MIVRILQSVGVMTVLLATTFSTCNITEKEERYYNPLEPVTPIVDSIIADDREDHIPCLEEYILPETDPIVTEEEVPTYDLAIEDIHAIARTLYGECRGVASDMEKAAVVWVILNRVDAGYGSSIIDVVTYPDQFLGYSEDNPLEEDLLALSEDVLTRWYREKDGETEVGRVLPENYYWFAGDGKYNYFRDAYRGGNRWDWSLENPYES